MKNSRIPKPAQTKFIVLGVVLLTILIGLITTEIQQQTYTRRVQQAQRDKAQLYAQGSALLTMALQKTKSASVLSIQDTHVLDIFGCRYINIYTSKHNPNESYAENKAIFENKSTANIKCPDKEVFLPSIRNGKYYWSDTIQAIKPEGESEYSETPLSVGLNVPHPTEYLNKYLDIQTTPNQIKNVIKKNEDLLVETEVKQKSSATFIFTIEIATQTLKQFTYKITEEGLTSNISGTVVLDYSDNKISADEKPKILN